jgi:uncharacterized phage protein gp47/JayE
MALNIKDFPTIVGDAVTAAQASSVRILDLTIGSILRAVFESVAAVALWLQAMIMQLLATTRASTSSGADLDSWIADYGMTPRLTAVAATGQVTFSRFTNTQPALIPVGQLLKTADGSQSFTVTIDTNNAAYSAVLAGYQIAAGVSSLTVPVSAVTGGSGGNVAAGTITTIGSPIAYVDTATNAAAFTNGLDAETDDQLRARFQAYVAGLSKATKSAVAYAITSLGTTYTYTITENQQYGGATDNGYFYVVVDDGTGAPTSTVLSTVYNAIDVVRPVAIRFGVFGPTLVTVPVVLTATIASGYDTVATKALVQTAIQSYINSLGLGNSLHYTRLLQVAYDASPGVTNISGLTVNGGAADITATAQQTIKSGTVTVN